ncbi:MAG: hypothetical protein KIT17_19775 [Rubrivivax sp.]|nr:hypothetical protein [Rubrivivax sp.]
MDGVSRGRSRSGRGNVRACAALLAAVAWLGTTAVHAGEAAGAAPAAGVRGEPLTGELRLAHTSRGEAALGPLASADALQPGITAAPQDTLQLEAELRHTLRGRADDVPVAITTNVLLRGWRSAGTTRGDAAFNELHLGIDRGAWQFSAGRKVVGWDVGYGFRPNDFVQQETRRTLLATTPQGRELLQAEVFDADTAHALLWVNPHHARTEAATSRGAEESALAWRTYHRAGALDAHGFARWGAHTGASVGAALAWVATDELELHASWRALRRHDGWRIDPAAGDTLRTANPWAQATLGGAAMWLVGASWTGAEQQSLIVEYWHDGTALPDADWDHWAVRNAALAASPAPAGARAGNLAWQATPFAAPSLRQDNLFVRAAWQPERWLLTLDALFAPADHGRIVTAGAQWQGERWRLNAAWRVAGGPADSVFVQLPTRRTGLLAATMVF